MTVQVEKDSDGIQYFWKDPDAELDFLFDWAGLTNGNWFNDWLQVGEVINSYTLTVPAGINQVLDQLNAAQNGVIVWLSGGTPCESYDVECEVVTNYGRTDERTMRIKVQNR